MEMIPDPETVSEIVVRLRSKRSTYWFFRQSFSKADSSSRRPQSHRQLALDGKRKGGGKPPFPTQRLPVGVVVSRTKGFQPTDQSNRNQLGVGKVGLPPLFLWPAIPPHLVLKHSQQIADRKTLEGDFVLRGETPSLSCIESPTSLSDSVEFSANPGESAMIKRELKHDMQEAQEIQNVHSRIVR